MIAKIRTREVERGDEALPAIAVSSYGIGAAATGALVKALTDIGIPEAEAGVYSDRLIAGNYLVILDGTDDEISQAEAILSKLGIQDWGVYSTNLAES